MASSLEISGCTDAVQQGSSARGRGRRCVAVAPPMPGKDVRTELPAWTTPRLIQFRKGRRSSVYTRRNLRTVAEGDLKTAAPRQLAKTCRPATSSNPLISTTRPLRNPRDKLDHGARAGSHAPSKEPFLVCGGRELNVTPAPRPVLSWPAGSITEGAFHRECFWRPFLRVSVES